MKQEITELFETEVAAFHRAEAKQVELDGLESRIADALAEGGDESYADAARSLTLLRMEAELIRRGTTGIRLKRMKAIEADIQEQAVQARQEAQRLRQTSTDLQQKSLKHLRALSELQGIDYDPSILSAQRVGQWMATPNGPAGIGLEMRAPDEAIADPGVYAGQFAVPRTRQLLNEAAKLDQQAQETEARSVRMTGSVSGENFDQLVAALRQDPTTVGPDLFSVAQWMLRVDQEGYEALSIEQSESATRIHRVEFQEGKLDAERSRLDVSLHDAQGFHQIKEFHQGPAMRELAA